MQLFWLLLTFVPSVTPHNVNGSSSLLWGTYRPNLYFGLRPRLPQSLMTGLVWFGTQDYQSFTSAPPFNDKSTMPFLTSFHRSTPRL